MSEKLICPCCKEETTYYGNFTYGCSTLGCRMCNSKGDLVFWVVANELQEKLGKAMDLLNVTFTHVSNNDELRAYLRKGMQEIESIKG